jgi:Dolichyl-phosphate-mannose-protein mannosyltransferase
MRMGQGAISRPASRAAAFGIAAPPIAADAAEAADRRRADAAVIAIIAGALALRLYGAAVLGLSVDESYAVAVSRVPTLSFFDHPPLGFMLARWMADLVGSEAAFWVRLPYLALATGSAVLLYRLTCRLFSQQAGVWAVAWFSIAPFFLILAGIWAMPDGPLMFFLLLAASLLRPLIFEDRPSRPLARWMAVGAAFGLAMLSKYQAFLVGFGALVFLLADHRGRRWLAHPGPYIAALVALVLFTPVLIWNAEHGWQSFAFQAGRAVAGRNFAFSDGATNVLRMLFGQAIYLLPGTLWLAFRRLRCAALTPMRRPEAMFCAALALPPILLFNGLAPFTKNFLPHWPMAGFLFAFPLIGDWMARLDDRRRKRARRDLATMGLIVGVVALVGAQQYSNGLVTRAVLGDAPAPIWDDTTQIMDWGDLERGLRERGWLKPGVVVAAKDWMQAAKISYILGGSVPVIVLKDDRRHFAFLEADALRGARQILLVGLAPLGGEPAVAVGLQGFAARRFCNIRAEPTITLMRGGIPYHSFVVLSARPAC